MMIRKQRLANQAPMIYVSFMHLLENITKYVQYILIFAVFHDAS